MTDLNNQLDRLGDALQRAVAADVEAADVAGDAIPSRRRRGARLGLGAAVAVTAVAVALIASAGGDGTPAAYAVETFPGGGMQIKIYSLGDPLGVEKALEEAGVASQVTYLGAGMVCREPHYQPSMALLHTLGSGPQPQPWAGFDYESSDGPLTIAVGTYEQRLAMQNELEKAVQKGDLSAPAAAPSFVVDPSGLRSHQTLVMTSAPTPDGYQQPAPSVSASAGQVKVSGQTQIDTIGQVRVAEGEVDPCVPVPAPESPAPVRAPAGGWDFSQAEYAGWGFGFGLDAAE